MWRMKVLLKSQIKTVEGFVRKSNRKWNVMKTLKIIIAIFTVFIMTMITTISTLAASELDVKESFSLHFLSKDIPADAQDFGRLYFSGLSTNELYDLGFTFEEMSDLRLAPAVTAYEYDECDNRYYYFPVLCANRVIAMLTLVDLGDGTYSAQFGKCKFAAGLNQLNDNYGKTYILVISEEGMFALDQENNFTLVDSYVIKSELSRNGSSDCEQPNVTFDCASLTNSVPVLINNRTLYDDTVNLIGSRLIWEARIDVPFVANGSNDQYPGGYCWASAITSVIKYRVNNSLIYTNMILAAVLSTGIDGYDYQIKALLEDKLNTTATLYSGTGAMSKAEIANVLSSGRPIYTDWQSFNESGAHSMVVRGVFVHDELIGADYLGYGAVSIMDPNESTYQSCSLIPGQKYVKGIHSFSWYSSVF